MAGARPLPEPKAGPRFSRGLAAQESGRPSLISRQSMDPRYFFDFLYPFQDEVLSRLAGLETDLYLTGGTCPLT